MPTNELCPAALLKSDAAALIGIIARLQGEAMLQQLDLHLQAALASRLQRDGVTDAADPLAFQAGLSGLNDRLRQALGE